MGQELDGWFQEPVLQCHFPWVIIFSMSDKESKEEIHMVEINRNACTGCGQCMSDCIANNLFLREGKQRCPETVSSAATVLLSVL